MGYCPQFSALVDSLNARDHLRLFARLRDIPEKDVNDQVEHWIARMSKFSATVYQNSAVDILISSLLIFNDRPLGMRGQTILDLQWRQSETSQRGHGHDGQPKSRSPRRANSRCRP